MLRSRSLIVHPAGVVPTTDTARQIAYQAAA
jgi:hypothetical protein